MCDSKIFLTFVFISCEVLSGKGAAPNLTIINIAFGYDQVNTIKISRCTRAVKVDLICFSFQIHKLKINITGNGIVPKCDAPEVALCAMYNLTNHITPTFLNFFYNSCNFVIQMLQSLQESSKNKLCTAQKVRT